MCLEELLRADFKLAALLSHRVLQRSQLFRAVRTSNRLVGTSHPKECNHCHDYLQCNWAINQCSCAILGDGGFDILSVGLNEKVQGDQSNIQPSEPKRGTPRNH